MASCNGCPFYTETGDGYWNGPLCTRPDTNCELIEIEDDSEDEGYRLNRDGTVDAVDNPRDVPVNI